MSLYLFEGHHLSVFDAYVFYEFASCGKVAIKTDRYV